MNARVYRLNELFPTSSHSNWGFYALNPGADKPFSVLMLDRIPDLAYYGSNAGQFFARWRYEKVDPEDGMLAFGAAEDGDVVDGYRRIDNITDQALARFQAAYGNSITTDDVFFYVYGLLHSPKYRETYAADLKKMLPRIPLVRVGRPFMDAGRRLSELHLGYESVQQYELEGLDAQPPQGRDPFDFYAVGKTKMSFGKPTLKQRSAGEKRDRTTIVYNSNITLRGVPEEAYRYMLGSRSAIEWIIDRYYIKTDKPSGIVNNPHDWSREVGDPRYILDLLARTVTVSLETMKVVDALPALDIRDDQGS
jgi:predicted helicase